MKTVKRSLPLLMIWLTSSLYGLAQNITDFIVNEGEVTTQVIPIGEQYRFPQFQPAEVYFRNNTFIQVTLNYNLLYGEMQFINDKGDTVFLVRNYRLKQVAVGKHLFLNAYNVGYVEVISSYPQVKLAKKQTLELTGSEVDLKSYYMDASIVTMNNQLGVGSVAKGKDWNVQDLYTQKAPGELQFDKKATYIIVDKNWRFYVANKITVLKLFPKHKKAIEEYISEYKPDFSQRNDLQGLLSFCSQLDTR